MPLDNHDPHIPDPAELRRLAEERLKAARTRTERLPPADVKELVYELQVHQIELETTIEDLKNTQIELSMAYNRYRELYDEAPVGYMTIDEKGKIIEANTTVAGMFTIPKAELVGKYLMSLVAVIDQDNIHQYLKEIRTSDYIHTKDFSFVRFQSTDSFDGRMGTKPGTFVEGRIREWKVTLVDITDEKDAQERLRHARLKQELERSLLQAIMDTIPVMLFVYNPSQKNLQVNDAVFRTTGWTEEEYQVSGIFELLFLGQNQHEAKAFLSTGLHEWKDFSIRCKDASVKVVNWTQVQLDDGRQVIIGIDVTERNRLEQDLNTKAAELTDANGELESFVYSVTHDLRNPLGAIAAFLQIIKEDYSQKLNGIGNEYLNRVFANINQMKQIINALLSLTQVGRSDLKYESVNLSDLANGVIAQLRMTCPRENVHVEIERDVVVQVDRSLIRIVMENLLQNAWKYSSKKDHTCIEFGKQIVDGKKVLFIRDNGAGFQQQYADRMFNPFQRLHSDKDFSGTGIGLATVKKIIERHGGTIRAEGTPGVGATIYFSLPD